MTPEEVEKCVLVASDATNLQNQQQANAALNHWISTTDDRALADALLPVLHSSQREVVLFFVLTAFLKLRETTLEQRARLRQEIFVLILNDSFGCWSPTYLRTKVGVLLASFIQMDFSSGSWASAFDDLQNPSLLQGAPDVLLRTLVALMDDFGHNETPINSKIKDMLRGFATTDENVQLQQPVTPMMPPTQSLSAQLLKTIVALLGQSLEVCNGVVPPQQLQICVLALTALKGFMAWIDLTLVLEEPQHTVLNLIFVALAKGSTTNSPMADAGVVAVECLQELIARGMEDEKRIAILIHTNALETIHSHVNLEEVDASPIDIVLEIAKFINRTGLEVLSVVVGDGVSTQNSNPDHMKVRSQLLDLFFRCFAYDDIDISGAVIPLAGSLIPSQDKQQTQQPLSPSDPVLSQLLAVTYRQARYPEDFQFDYEDEDEAEEEMYRTELRKLNQKLIRAAPDASLQFICQILSQLPLPLSSAPMPNMEAALRLVYHYCEGIRPPPGMKVVMRNETFRNLLVALHTSEIIMHPHREVVALYYETAVRYYPLLRERPDLLQKVLGSLSGPRGLQHEHSRVRSRCCYMLLRLVKLVGNNSTSKGDNVLRPYVETAVSGIQGLLENNTVQLRLEDTLNLFETIGLLLGKTGLEPVEQQRYLTQVMTPHVRSIEQVLERKEAVLQDPETFGEMLSGSIAAIAFLSKGFKRPSEPVQLVLLQTLQIACTVLETLPALESIRSKTMVLIQRLIQCLEYKVLPSAPRLLYILIANCTTADILDVAQLLNQLCIKFKEKAVPAMDAALLPFLQKCHALALDSVVLPTSTVDSGNGTSTLAAPHQRTEQLSIQKLTYMVLNHISLNNVADVLLTPTNLPALEKILHSMSEGAIYVEDTSIKRTCLVFFKEILDNWAVDTQVQTTRTPPPAGVVHGYIQFVCSVLIPGVLQSFAQKSFNIQDANSWRVVMEFAALLDLLHHRLPDVYDQEVLVSTMAKGLACTPAIVESFRSATGRKAMETSLKILIEHRTQN